MSVELIIFGIKKEDVSIILDNGTEITGHDAVHPGPDHRPGVGYTIPGGSASGNGFTFKTAKSKLLIAHRGLMMIKGENGFEFPGVEKSVLFMDDFRIVDVPEVIPIPVPPIPNPPNPPSTDPMAIINAVFATGKHNLKTKEGCGKFTEACCKELHDKHDNDWGHIRKTGAQNSWPEPNGDPNQARHAVDAIMLLMSTQNTEAGVYDIIADSESNNAKPAFNFKHGPQPDLWYYPA